MRGYLSLAGKDDAKEIPVEERVGLYRIQERNQQVFAEVEGNVIPLGVSDPTVSRKKDTAPVAIVPREEFVEVRNNGNHNPVKVDEKATDTVDSEVAEGAVATLKRDATIEIGYQTTLKLVVERSRKKEVNVQGEKVVMGDEVDQSTNVTDSVVNRSDIGDGSAAGAGEGSPGTAGSAAGAGGGGANVEDSVVNRSNVGGGGGGAPAGGGGQAGGGDGSVGADTQRYCDVHDRTYSGEECPRCAADREREHQGERSPGGAGGEPRGQAGGGGGSRNQTGGGGGTASGASDGGRDTKYCMFCGEEMPGAAAHCPACGEEQLD